MYPAHLIRVSDAEREVVVAHLSAATAEGRLTLDEFSERTRRAYAARTWVELTSLTLDLPAPRRWIAPAAPPGSGSGTALSWVSMLVGVVSIVVVAFLPVNAIAGVTAIVLGVMGLRAAGRGEPSHRGMALAGVVCGMFGVLLTVAWIAFLIVLA